MVDKKFFIENFKPLGYTICVKGAAVDDRPYVHLPVKNQTGTIGFHFNPRYDEKMIVMNNCVNWKWQHEQMCEQGDHFKWQKGSIVALKFKVTNEGIRSYWHGEVLKDCFFKHRVKVADYAGLHIGGIEIRKIKFVKHDEDDATDVVTDLKLNDFAFQGKYLTVKAKSMLPRPAINFLVNKSPDDIALHFNPRFDEKILILASNVKGKEKETKLSDGFRWKENVLYVLHFYVADERIYCVWKNEQVFSFDRPSPVTAVVGLKMCGWCIQSIELG